jgi:hypothetical protein
MTLEQEIATALNRHCAENGSDTPDFILAQFLLGCLAAYNVAVEHRDKWLGRVPKPLSGAARPPVASPEEKP